jgi:DNA-binding NarL/FixJ family response regulator
MNIHLVIIEDDQELLQSLVEYFATAPEFSIIDAFPSVELFLSRKSTKAPDIILLDLVLPGMNGIDGIPLIKAKYPSVNILVNTVLDDSNSIFKALKYGAIGYITKGSKLDQIKLTLINAHNGMSVMSQDIAAQVIDYFRRPDSLIEKLTKKEMDIAELLKLGMSYKMIAHQNEVTIDAIRFHVRNIYKKLEINSKGELINLMTRN